MTAESQHVMLMYVILSTDKILALMNWYRYIKIYQNEVVIN